MEGALYSLVGYGGSTV